MKSVFLCNDKQNPARVYSQETRNALLHCARLSDAVYSKEDVLTNKEFFKDTEYVFSTWGMPVFSADEVADIFPSLKCIFYAAGTVQYFARPFLEKGIKVFSAWKANAVPVAEYAVAQIILANKGFFGCAQRQSSGDIANARQLKNRYPGSYGEYIGILGAGAVGSLVIKMLKNYHLRIKVFDPFLSAASAEALGVEKCTLEEIFSNCFVISNHLANNNETKQILKKHHFESMRKYATFINTGRGAQVDEYGLADVLSERPDITAILDVTEPEPPESGHPFYRLENCILTPHIAGSNGDEVQRMGEYMLDEYMRLINHEPTLYEVSLKMLETMA